jgi:hypothetical protein
MADYFMQNPFKGPGFDMISMTETMNMIPNNYGRIQQAGIFNTKTIPTTIIGIEEQHGVLNIIPSVPRGSPSTKNTTSKRKMRYFELLHVPLDDQIKPEDLQNIRAYGQNTLKQAAQEMLERLVEIRLKHAITLEYFRMGAMMGEINNADGSLLMDLYEEFGITKKTISFDTSTATTDIRMKCFEVVRWMEDHLLGEVMLGAEVWADQVFFDALVSHKVVKETYLNYAEAAERVGGDVRKGFTYGGIKFSEYRAVASTPDGTTRKFIPEGTAIAFPTGTTDTFKTFFGPANYISTVNTMGQELYARIRIPEDDRSVEIETEQNPLPICKRPALLVHLNPSRS